MAIVLDKVKVGANWKVVQISGPADASAANYISFETPVEIRRVEAATTTKADFIKIYVDRDGSGDPEQQVMIAQTPPIPTGCTGMDNRWLIHPVPFQLSRPQTQIEQCPDPGGKIYIVTQGGGNWSLTVEARG